MDETLWHKCLNPLFPRRTVDGGWTNSGVGQTWCRRRNGKWEYKQDEETYEAFLERQERHL